VTESLFDARELRKVAHQAVTEGVNLQYVERMRQALYAAADRIEALEAGEPPERPVYWIVRDEGTAIAYWGPFDSRAEASRSGLYDEDGSSEIVRLIANPQFAAGAAGA
jgi:hypothetical protein